MDLVSVAAVTSVFVSRVITTPGGTTVPSWVWKSSRPRAPNMMWDSNAYKWKVSLLFFLFSGENEYLVSRQNLCSFSIYVFVSYMYINYKGKMFQTFEKLLQF